MLAKCANPACSAGFRYLAQGRLFRLDADSTLMASRARATEYFWLCEGCSAGMTLCLSQDGRVVVTGVRGGLRNASRAAFVPVAREDGLLLRGVSFVRSGTSREAQENA